MEPLHRDHTPLTLLRGETGERFTEAVTAAPFDLVHQRPPRRRQREYDGTPVGRVGVPDEVAGGVQSVDESGHRRCRHAEFVSALAGADLAELMEHPKQPELRK